MRRNPPVRMNRDYKLFYCWGWDKFFPVRKLGEKCFNTSCRFMYVPSLPHLRKEAAACG